MAKYNIREYKESGASYQESINPDILDELHTKILNILLIQRKFMDKDYSAKKLAQDLNTNSRYVSAVCNVKFHMNYATLINKYPDSEFFRPIFTLDHIHFYMNRLPLPANI